MKNLLILVMVMIITIPNTMHALGQKKEEEKKLPTFKIIPRTNSDEVIETFQFAQMSIIGAQIDEPISSKKMEVVLIPCKECTFLQAKKAIADAGYVPAPTSCLLGLGVKDPEIQREFKKIIALGDEKIILTPEQEQAYFMLATTLYPEPGSTYIGLQPTPPKGLTWYIAMKPQK